MAAIDVVADLVADEAAGMTRRDLSAAIARRQPGTRPVQAGRLIDAALAAGAVVESGGRIRATGSVGETSAAKGAVELGRGHPEQPLRVVAFDVESVVRLTAEAPTYTEARIFQLGAVRFGRDKAWCHSRRSFDEFVELPDENWEISSDAVRARYEERRRPLVDVLEDFREFVADADVLVAYNGTGVDFGLLAEAFGRSELPELDHVRYVDGYYVALALWPTPPRQHRLAQLAERVGAKMTRLHWHDALDDSVLLSRLLTLGARQFALRSLALLTLVASATVDSCAWELVFDLAGVSPATRIWTDSEVAGALGHELTGVPRRREPPPPSSAPPPAPPAPLVLSPDIVDAAGRVSPFALATRARDDRGEPRPAQEAMTDHLRSWINSGEPGLVEAPTGTGKSYAMLANALEWLASEPARRVIIATFTKQLQSQLASDIQALAYNAIPELATVSDLVKGKSNRLSLRALAIAMADCTGSGNALVRTRRGRRTPFAADTGYRELVVFLVLRLLAPATLSEAWEGYSVDGVDIPVFFEDYLDHRRGVYLATLSQAAVGEYPNSDDEIALHTESVRDALANHRLIIANHALLLANLDELGLLGPDTLLLIDEAHMLEDAATGAMSDAFDYATVEQVALDIDRYVTNAPAHPRLAEIADLNREFEQFLDAEQLPGATMAAFDDGSGEPGSRVISIASPRGGAIGINHTFALVTMLRDLRGRLRQIKRAMFAYQKSGLGGVDHFEFERFQATLSKVTTLEEAVDGIILAIETIIGPPTRRGNGAAVASSPTNEPGADGQIGDGPSEGKAAGSQTSGDQTANAGLFGREAAVESRPVLAAARTMPGAKIPELAPDGALPDDESPDDSVPDDSNIEAAILAILDARDAEVSDDPASSGEGNGGEGYAPASGSVVPIRLSRTPAPNRVVWSEETGRSDLAANRRQYRFRLTSSPIALGAEEAWRRFLTTFPRTYYISATLTVAGGWGYITSRLGIAPDTRAVTLSSPFDIANQALLVAFSDFPSWAEQQAQAIRSVAWQLKGYAREVIRPGPLNPETGATAWENGAMVLTTSKLAASEISAKVEELLVADGQSVPVRPAIVLGNQRAVANFKLGGGIIVGTKGLWQGVDIDDSERLRMVWINKLPFAPFADPVIAARRALVAEEAEGSRSQDPTRLRRRPTTFPLPRSRCARPWGGLSAPALTGAW